MGVDNAVTNAFTFVDLFAGLGGFHQAAMAHGGVCVMASEINPDLSKIYEKNFGIKPLGDIRNIDVNLIPDHDVLFAGFPCQPFSKAGKQLGWEDAVRGTLFQNIAAIAKIRQPKVLLLENVAHFVRHDDGNTYQKVHEALAAIGYSVIYKQYSPHQFSVPHIRERIYLVATRGRLEGFAWPEHDKNPALDIGNILDERPEGAIKLSTRVEECLDHWQEFLTIIPSTTKLPSFPIWSMEAGATYPFSRRNLYSYSLADLNSFYGSFGRLAGGTSKREILKAMPAYARSEAVAFPMWKKNFIRQNREFFREHSHRLGGWLERSQKFPASLQKFEWNCQGEERDISKLIVQFRASGVRVKRRNTAPSLVAMTSTQVPIIPWENRYMTTRECARLQSMGRLEHLPSGELGMSAMGNAVNVEVAVRVLKSVISAGALNHSQDSYDRPA